MTHLDITFKDARYTHPEFTHIDYPEPGDDPVSIYTSDCVLLAIELSDSALSCLPESFPKTIITTGYATRTGENDAVQFVDYCNILGGLKISDYEAVGWCELPNNTTRKEGRDNEV